MTQVAKDAAKFLKSTLRLPSATFPPRAPPADIAKYLPRCTDDLYAWQRQHRPVEDTFTLHDGPPYANGDLHVGHALNKILKDILCRTALAQGKRVDYVPGWDCHGLPIELKALEHHGWQRGQNEDPVAVRKAARNFASNTVRKQMKGFKSWGIMADWENHWKTMDKNFEIRQLEIFQAMAEHDLIYRRHKPVFWSPSSGTALAEAELEYKDDHISTAAYVKFPLTGLSHAVGPVYALIWTTTPWTLPANQAIAVHSGLEYVLVQSAFHGNLVIARSRLVAVEEVMGEKLRIVRDIHPTELLQCVYDGPSEFKPFSSDRPLIHADFVSAESGTGLVHCAPGHGMEDYLALSRHIADGRVTVRAPVDNTGRFDASASPDDPGLLNGLEVFKDGNQAVLQLLQGANLLVNSAKYKHKYPIDWRTKEPVMIRATAQWFADVSSIRDDTLKALDLVRFVPQTGKSRLRSFVENRSEWCISRQRSWGVPIPAIYHRDSGEAVLTPKSVRHIIDVIQQRGIDAWWSDSADEPAWIVPGLNPSEFQRGTDTMDVWFDSGTSWTAMSTAAPQEKPLADVYLEGSDQHRGWFQSSLLTHVAFQKSTGKSAVLPPFQSLLTHGFTLDAQGKKMSKSLGNVVGPDQIVAGLEPTARVQQVQSSKKHRERHSLGPDALRLWVAGTDFTKDVVISETVVKTTHTTLDKYRVTMKVLLGMLQDFDPATAVAYEKLSKLDQMALLQLSVVTKGVQSACSEHEFHRAVLAISRWVAVDLSGFYLEGIKDIIYCDSPKHERRLSASTTLYHIFRGMQDMLAPILPLLVEESFEHSPAAFKTLEHPLRRVQQAPPSQWHDTDLQQLLPTVMSVNSAVKAAQEAARAEKLLGQSLASDVTLFIAPELGGTSIHSLPRETWQEILVVSDVKIVSDDNFGAHAMEKGRDASHTWIKSSDIVAADGTKIGVAVVTNPARGKCARCWRYMAATPQNEELPLCKRCDEVVQEFQH
ncbi:isoleucine-tRNA ligase [Cyphellophora europaea CBS 101466]|uniref:Isoleucine--tRNA ligase, mitochondrial n=1 Tax=Cyphellophora europaea (strain CBS 101466) TaxID=1220924 RepID=W2RR50_CYPE1|nr:isoleucine-tRNA ligase [Cyphellophora europaea CBS 101466]ETN38198.1 isoleucine-tRNA ligase [Cyphellophora europaea CBS 101466]